MGTFTFNSPAITASLDDGWWIIRREGKGDWLRFDLFGGFLYLSERDEPVGSIYIKDGPTASADPCFSYKVTHACECGNPVERDVIKSFATPSQAVEEAAFFFLS
jgi:hypothetical protein